MNIIERSDVFFVDVLATKPLYTVSTDVVLFSFYAFGTRAVTRVALFFELSGNPG